MNQEVALLLVRGCIFRGEQSKEARAEMHEQGAGPLEPLWLMQRTWSDGRQPGL